ncbi:MAG: hypothetical protein WKF89_18700 [Chitinophagaceae bacterium]
MFKKDDLKFGILLGFIAPFIGLVIYYFVSFYSTGIGFVEFLGYLRQYRTLLTGVSSISLVANAVIFTIFINSYKDRTARGIFLATLLYGVGVLLVKFIL